jgi:DNA (cytosine-5)-methyltransferase 1
MPTATDQFCGAGGTSEGAVAAGVEVVVATNHWRLAIETHGANHPGTDHICADISQIDPRRYPSTDILLTSPECTNHTSAKNHNIAASALTLWDPKQAAERSRATMWDVPRFAEYHRYGLIIVENVVEVRSWAPYEAWLASLSALGYDHQLVYLNSRFVGAPQSRDRLYTVLWDRARPRPDMNISRTAWCAFCEADVQAEQTWTSTFQEALTAATKRNGGVRPARIRWGLHGQQYHYTCPTCSLRVVPYSTPALIAVDWTLAGKRIGDSTLAKSTLVRIQKGIDKYGRQPILVPLDHSGGSKLPTPFWRPFPTQTGRQDSMVVHPFLAKLAGAGFEHEGSPGCRTRPVTDQAWTQTTTQETGLVMVPFISELRGGGSVAHQVTEPTSTVSAEGNHHMLIDGFYSKGYGDGHDPSMNHRLIEPFGTVTTQDHHGLVQYPLIDTFYGTGSAARPVSEPTGTATTKHRHALVDPGVGVPDIEDCMYRMLQPHEIQRVMAFRDSYRVLGNQRDKVRQLGNAVTPPASQLLLERAVPAVFG